VFGAILPQPEICNGIDDNCDGLFDNNDPGTLAMLGASRCGIGACERNGYDCHNGMLSTCTPGTPSEEICDGKDNDCNGVIDDGCFCRIGDVRQCYTGPSNTKDAGVCHGGTRPCIDGGYTKCEGEVVPSPELCNGLDDNCNGMIDEMCLAVDGGTDGGAGGGSSGAGGGAAGTGGGSGSTGGGGPDGAKKVCGCSTGPLEPLLLAAFVLLRRRRER
jgi:uncharacterized protein (TIGR03382 family)